MMSSATKKSNKQSPVSKAENTNLMNKPKKKNKQSPVSKADDMRVPDSFSCPFCDKIFKNRSSLTRHIKIHDEHKAIVLEDEVADQLFPCSECSKAFAKKTSLLTHMKTHSATSCVEDTSGGQAMIVKDFETNLFPFKCPVCPDRFAEEWCLIAHYKIHCDESVYVCETCSSTFANRLDFNVHLVTHTNQTSFKCKYCGEIFKDFISRRLHARRHAIWCGVCDITFKSVNEYATHIVECHRKKFSSNNIGKREVCDEESHIDVAESSVTDSSFHAYPLLPKTKAQVPPEKANVSENLNSSVSYVIPKPNTSGTLSDTSSSTIDGDNSGVSQNSEGVASSFVQSNILNQLMLMDPLLATTGFFPRHVDPATPCIDFNIKSYIPCFQTLLDLSTCCKYPLQYELYERISHCLKIISNIIGHPSTKINDQQNLAVLFKFHKKFSKISRMHLMHIAKNIFK